MSTENDLNQSPSLGALAAALAKAQGVMHSAAKDKTNPHFGKPYADLASVWDACREPLSANGLAVVQKIATGAGGVLVTTMLLHSSGEWIQDKFLMPVQANTAQGVGAAVTYGRRYALSAMVGVAPDDDDDGNEATKLAPNQQGPGPDKGRKENRPVSNKQAKEPKGEPAPESQSKETDAEALRIRRNRLWANFQKANGKEPDWKPWLAQCLGEPKTSASLTLADCAKLEMELANGLNLISEPPADGPPEDDGFKVPPLVRMTALAAEYKMPLQSILTKAQALLGKSAGWTHEDVEKMHAELVKGAK